MRAELQRQLGGGALSSQTKRERINMDIVLTRIPLVPKRRLVGISRTDVFRRKK